MQPKKSRYFLWLLTTCTSQAKHGPLEKIQFFALDLRVQDAVGMDRPEQRLALAIRRLPEL
jgi:hypothetical protein